MLNPEKGRARFDALIEDRLRTTQVAPGGEPL